MAAPVDNSPKAVELVPLEAQADGASPPPLRECPCCGVEIRPVDAACPACLAGMGRARGEVRRSWVVIRSGRTTAAHEAVFGIYCREMLRLGLAAKGVQRW